MTKEMIKRCIESGRLQLTNSDKYTHYGIVIAFLIPLLLLICFWTKILILGGQQRPHPDFYPVTEVATLLAIISFIIQYRRLKFIPIATQLNAETLLKVFEDALNSGKWTVAFRSQQAIVIKTDPGFWSGSWGEQITILFDTGRVLVNSICDPDKPSSVVSFGRNSSIVDLFKVRIKSASR